MHGIAQLSRGKSIAILFSILMLISMGASLAIPNAAAHTPAWQIPTFAHIFAAPNPVGIGQQMWIDMFLANPPFFSAAFTNNYRFHNYQLTITAPNGTSTSVNFPYIADSTNNQNYAFTPTDAGVYTLTFTYPGEIITASLQPAGSLYVNDTYLPRQCDDDGYCPSKSNLCCAY